MGNQDKDKAAWLKRPTMEDFLNGDRKYKRIFIRKIHP